MRTIFKYPIFFEWLTEPFLCDLSIPVESELIHVGSDLTGQICAWFEHNTEENRRMNFEIAIVGTGQNFTLPKWEHYKTFLNGALVLHIYTKQR